MNLNALSPKEIVETINKKANHVELAHRDASPSATLTKNYSGLTPSEDSVLNIGQNIFNSFINSSQAIIEAEYKRRNNFEINDNKRKLETCSDEYESSNIALISQTTPSLDSLIKVYKTRKFELSIFKEKNNLSDKEAKYADSDLLHIGIIASLIVGEALFNANFLAKGQELGLLGGAILSMTFSLINFLLSYTFGLNGIRQIGHVNAINKWLGWLSLTFYAALLGAFNLLTGHYRDVLSSDPYTAAQSATLSFVAGPFNIATLEGWTLALIGALFSLVYVGKLLLHDDPYPGFGKVTRAFKGSERNANKEFENLIKKIEENSTQFKKQVTTHSSRITREIIAFGSSIQTVQSIESNRLNMYNNINNAVKDVINKYRSVLLTHNSSYGNAFFKAIKSIKLEYHELDLKLDDDNEKIDIYAEISKAIGGSSFRQHRKILSLQNNVIKEQSILYKKKL